MKHGTRSTYARYGCRCEPCKAAAREYMRFYRGSFTTTAVATSRGAHTRALSRLVDRYPDEFRRLLEDEVAGEVAP